MATPEEREDIVRQLATILQEPKAREGWNKSRSTSGRPVDRITDQDIDEILIARGKRPGTQIPAERPLDIPFGRFVPRTPAFNLLRQIVPPLVSPEFRRPLVTPEMVGRLPEPLQPLGTAAREFTSPLMIAATALTAGAGPAVAGAIRGGTGLLGAARGAAAGLVAPIVKGPFAARMAAELGVGTAATLAAQETGRRIPETAPTAVKVAAPLAAGLAGGMGAIGALRGAQAAVPAARTAIAKGLVQAPSLPVQKAVAATGEQIVKGLFRNFAVGDINKSMAERFLSERIRPAFLARYNDYPVMQFERRLIEGKQEQLLRVGTAGWHERMLEMGFDSVEGLGGFGKIYRLPSVQKEGLRMEGLRGAEVLEGEAPSIPEGITRHIDLAEEMVRQASPGRISRALDAIPGTRQLYRFFVPARKLTHNQHVAWVARSTSASEYLTQAFAARNQALRVLDEAFGSGFKKGEKVALRYIGPIERSKSPLIGTAIDILPNPDHYALSQTQMDAIARLAAYEDWFLGRAINDFGVEIGRFPTKEGAAFVPNVDVAESALEVMGDAWTAARTGRAKPRIWEDAVARQKHTPSFKPEQNLELLMEASDQAKANLIARQVFKTELGGLNKQQVLEKTHPALAAKMGALKKRLLSLRGSAGTLETKIHKAITEFLNSPLDDVDLTALRDDLDVTLARGPRKGMNVAEIQNEITQVRADIKRLQPYWKAANLKPYVFVQEGIYRYFPVQEAKSLRQLLEVSDNPFLSLAYEIRNIAFNLDLSPITGVHLPLGFLADPVGTIRQLVRGTKTEAQKIDFLKAVKSSALADDIAKDPVSWGEFAAVSGSPVGATAEEFAGGILRRIPGYTTVNEGMFTLVTRRSKAMFDDMVRGLEKDGVPHDEAVVAASEITHSAIPLVNTALLGQSQARAKLLRSITISPSFIIRPPQLMAEAAKALVKVGLKKTLTSKEKTALRTALTLAATIETISVTSAVIDAWVRGKDVDKAAIDALTDMALHLPGGRKIPLGGPFRSMVTALRPQWVNKEMDYMMPFVGVPRWAIGKLTPMLRTQYDLIRNKDFMGRRIVTGDFPVNILQIVAYEFEGVVPLSIAAWIEGKRTGASLAETAETAASQLAGMSIYERPGPWSFRSEWRDELRTYWDIPPAGDLIGRKQKMAEAKTWADRRRYEKGREYYRTNNPDVDAKLLIVGETSSLNSDKAVTIAIDLIKENNIEPGRIAAIRDRIEKREEANKAGVTLKSNNVDTLIQRLDISLGKIRVSAETLKKSREAYQRGALEYKQGVLEPAR